jgi:cytochrome c551/c552
MVLGSLSFAAPAYGEDAQVLLQKYKCNACHSTRETKTGPAFMDVAARYRGDSQAVSTLATSIKDGTHGAGPWAMPPHPEISAADARRLARYILAPEVKPMQ